MEYGSDSHNRSTLKLRLAEVCAMDKSDRHLTVSLSEGFRSFKEGLDKKLLYAYWLAVWGHAWEIWWGAGVIGVICTVLTLYYAPSRWILGWAVAWVFLVAGYFTWRADRIRLQQKIEVTRVRTHSWPHLDGGTGTQYYFGVVNKSEAETIHKVRVQLLEIIPAVENRDWLPIPLHLQHDNPLSGVLTQSFDLHPREPRNIDLFTTATATGNSVAHIAPVFLE
jgi:hypothetical protein